ncbi:hypothetical protein FNV43_RR08019 [Rhamnella rubrinervis]|uniref:Pentatricopeptide repeat-containing protein n=1 Tax=Rhamnella rubrinervis TaxID=2594499 RepID=A0A8K0HH06_9ROSA|nr:hypothetical protein FNV43_RR08019 [Rhamnella rubrinervis]
MEASQTQLCSRPKPNLKPTNSDIDVNVYNCNNEIMKLGRLGRVKEARNLFDQMSHQDAVSYSSMITIYLKNDDLPSAETLYRKMPRPCIVADSAMIDGYMKAGCIDEARRVFDAMEERNVYSWTSLISGYFSCGQPEEALRVFHQMPEKNVVSWTTVVLGYARSGLVAEARNVFDLMPERNTVAWTAMIKAYVQSDQFDEAYKLFNEMPQRNLYSWNIIISGCLGVNRVSEAVQLFNSMPQRSAISWTTMVTGLAHNKMIKLAKEYFDYMPKKDVAAWNAMISAYVDEGLMVEASKLFIFMPERNSVTWNTMIDGYARNGLESEALNHLILMLRSCFRPSGSTISSVLTSCKGMLELTQAHALLISLGFERSTLLMNVLVTMYSRYGDVHSARLAFEHLEAKDTVSWTSMLLAYSNHGYGQHALQVFACMLRSGAKPDVITFVGVLSACSHAGLVSKGQRLFESMNCAYGLEPKAEHYSCLIDMLGRAGQVDEAAKMLSKMPPSELDGPVLGALLGACRLHGDVKLASCIGEKLMELEPTSSGVYVVLANVYAANGKWHEFAQLKKMMKERNVKKAPGFSQIEVKGKSHVFFAGDRSHPEIEDIHGLLQEKLHPLMMEMSYSRKELISGA